MRPIYAERRSVLVAELERQLGDNVTIMGDQAGMHLAIFLTRPRRSKNRGDGCSTIALALSAIVLLHRKDGTSRFCSWVRKYEGERHSPSRSAFEKADLPIA